MLKRGGESVPLMMNFRVHGSFRVCSIQLSFRLNYGWLGTQFNGPPDRQRLLDTLVAKAPNHVIRYRVDVVETPALITAPYVFLQLLSIVSRSGYAILFLDASDQ